MDWVKDKMGLRFGCEALLFLPNWPTPLPSPTILPHLGEKEAALAMEKVEDLEGFLVQGDQKGFSECSSGCQSGWTLYLCQSRDGSLAAPSLPPRGGDVSVHEDEEDDLSMLSDASSGPPHAAEGDCINFFYCSAFARNGIGKRRKAVEENQQKQRRQKESSPFLDDTASSPFSKATSSISSSKKMLAEDALDQLSSGFSANHFKRKASPKKNQMGNYLHSSARLNQAPGCREEEEEEEEEDENNLI